MKRFLAALAVAAVCSGAFANPVPVTDTTKRPYKASKIYCNDAIVMAPSEGENIACYNHDACYADPQEKNREDCDEAYLRDMKLAGLGVSAYIRFRAVRQWGAASWNRSREKDRWQEANN
ncbi:MAG: hypothetical protein KL863_01645 [Rhizobium sp.]|nr:hypothetical protein [Rhizobium sp.]